jgi:hypothetical protein
MTLASIRKTGVMKMRNRARQSIRALSEKCGFHYSTVSLALRNSPKINSETRRKILAAAREFGYELDPSSSIIMSNIRKQRNLLGAFPIGMLNFHKSGMPHSREMTKALKTYAAHNDIPFNLFDLSGGDLTQKQVCRIAKSRGLRGLIFGGSSEKSMIEWDLWKDHDFAYLVYSQRTEDLLVDHVTWDVISILDNAVHALEKKECRHFALLVKDFIDAGSGWRLSSTIELIRKRFRHEGKAGYRIRKFANPDSSFREWVLEHQPVGVIRVGPYLYPDSNLSELFPGQDIGYSVEYPHCPEPDRFSIGHIEPDYQHIAETSFDTLCVNLFFNRNGIPKSPKCIYLRSVFVPSTQRGC